MRPSFIPRLVNTELYDPVVYVRVLNEKKAVMFDCGRVEGLANREVLDLDAIFISHTHMDHFMGIDQVLRIILHRRKPLNIYGPEGITDKVLAKLRAYTWNLTKDYPLEIYIHEILDSTIRSTRTRAAEGFDTALRHEEDRSGHTIARDSRYLVDAVILDHNIPCLGFVIKEIVHVNIKGNVITRRGYIPGAWIGRLKECILSGETQTLIDVMTDSGIIMTPAAELAHELIIATPGQKVAFFTDIACTKENIRHMESIALDADMLFIETYYLDEMREQAIIKGHLTARQAGMIAGRLRAKRVFPMHVSPRYHSMLNEIRAEMDIKE
ncbi:MAG: MBL fold metallo-hydrolase [Deltaproteobacteria bacterium]|nr:MBL fold metallo-hydrolase [Deltaproteobacteria bacterium]